MPLAIILARAGSKGLPGKNAALVAGRPCIAWTIAAAQASKRITQVAVSADGEELQRIAFEMGADVIARPPELATDTATVDAAARHAVSSLSRATEVGSATSVLPAGSTEVPQSRDFSGTPPDPIVILYANVPIRPEGLIDRAIDLLVSTHADSVQSYSPVGKHHPWWTARIDPETGRVRPWEGQVLNHGVFRRQDLPPAYIPDGGIIAVTRQALFLQTPEVPAGPHAFFGREDRRHGIINPEGSVVDIDTAVDLAVADAMLEQQNRARQEAGPIPVLPLRDRQGAAPASDRAPAPPARPVPLAYFITFRTYGTWLHGDHRQSVDRHHNAFREPPIEPDEQLEAESARRMKQAPVILEGHERAVMTATVREVCAHRGWVLHAVNVRTNHVHAVIAATLPAERVMNDLKSWGTRRLREAGARAAEERTWSRHGSTRYLWDSMQVADACNYVVNMQDNTDPGDIDRGPCTSDRVV